MKKRIKTKNTIFDDIRAQDILRITLGALLTAVSFDCLRLSSEIVAGGISGLAQILYRLIGTPIGLFSFLMNVPLFLWARKDLGRRFVLLSLLAMSLSNLFIDVLQWVSVPMFHGDKMLAAVYGGLLSGAGWGLVYTTGCCGGGIDIPARMLRRRFPHVDFNTFVLLLDGAAVVLYALIFHNIDCCMYTIICMFIASKVEGLILYGPINSRSCFIISDRSDELRIAITNRLGRGCTMLQGKGAWSGLDKQVILCVVKPAQVASLRRIVKEIDAHAFLVVSDARSVYGDGFENLLEED